MGEEDASRVSFFSKNKTLCPICKAGHFREELLTGRGRLIAGDLTDELRRLYEPSKKFGDVYPLVYSVTVCPECYFAVFPWDFQIPGSGEIQKVLREEIPNRFKSLNLIFDALNFKKPRTLKEGVAAYILAIMCYDFFPTTSGAIFNQGIAGLRAAWLADDLHSRYPDENWDYIRRVFYRKTRFFYTHALEEEQKGKEGLGNVKHLGPDLDKNYGYDGVLYLASCLEYKYGDKSEPEKRAEALVTAKRTVAKVYGLGKATKEKPSPLRDKAKILFEKISAELKEEGADAETEH